MKKATFSTLLFCFALPASAASQYLDLHALEFQRSRMDQGIETIDSFSDKTSVRIIEPQDKVSRRVRLSVIVYNHGDEPFNFGPENIQATIGPRNEAVAVVPYERLLKEEKNRAGWRAAFAAMGAAGNNMAAANAGTSYGTFNAYSRQGYVGGGNWQSYNSGQAYAAQSLANAQNRQLFDSLTASNLAGLQALGANLRTTTIDPQDFYGGQVTLELPKSARKAKNTLDLTLIVNVGPEVHVFEAGLVSR